MDRNPNASVFINGRQSKHYVTFTDSEFAFVSGHTELTATEKLIWFNLVRKSLLDPNFTCRMTHAQIAMMVGVKQDTAYRAVKRLKEHGFLIVRFDSNTQISVYAITLPEEGIEAIKNAPDRGERNRSRDKYSSPAETRQLDNRNLNDSEQAKSTNAIGLKSDLSANKNQLSSGLKTDSPPDFDPVFSGLKSGTPPDKDPILLINNNINNIHNTQSLEYIGNNVKNASALVCEFEALHKKYAGLSPINRMQTVKSNFNSEEMHIISLAIIERQRVNEIMSNKQKAVQEKSNVSILRENIANSQTESMKSYFIEFKFEGDTFLIEEEVKNQILFNIPLLYHQNKFKGPAAEQPLKVLLKEILYYVTKSGSILSTPVSQLKRYYIARKICLDGGWEKPKGMVRGEIIQREKHWEVSKNQENEASKAALQTIRSLTCNVKP